MVHKNEIFKERVTERKKNINLGRENLLKIDGKYYHGKDDDGCTVHIMSK